MLMPKNGATAATPCGGKTNMAAAVYPYSGPAAAPDTFQPMAMPLNGQYPVASKSLRINRHSIQVAFVLESRPTCTFILIIALFEYTWKSFKLRQW